MTEEKKDTATEEQKVETTAAPDAMMEPRESVFTSIDQDGNVEILKDDEPDEEGGEQPEGAGEAEKKDLHFLFET